jgi:hypothetical protein
MAAGVTPGKLGAVAIEANLTGLAHPSAVVGSTDGWLYAMNACTAELDFAVEIGAAVGDPIFADTDGDGRDEILVVAADGYLYDLRQKGLDGPPFVWDIDPAHGIVNRQVYDEDTKDTLSGRWGGVNGALGYEVAILDDGGHYISDPAWRAVGTASLTSIRGLPLVDGEKYHFAVRALGEGSSSPAIVSAGVIVHRGEGLYPLYGRACTCGVYGRGAPASGAGVVALTVLLLVRRRRRIEARRD